MASPSLPPIEPPPPPRSATNWRSWLIVALVVLGGLIYLAHERHLQQQQQAALPLSGGQTILTAESVSGRPAPDWTLPQPNGQPLSLAQLKGHPVVMDFWASWCGPCKIEIPWWNQLQAKYQSQGLVIVGISEDSGMAPVKKFLSSHAVNYKVVLANPSIQGSYGFPYGLPTTIFIRPNGQIASRVIGLEDPAQLQHHVKQIL